MLQQTIDCRSVFGDFGAIGRGILGRSFLGVLGRSFFGGFGAIAEFEGAGCAPLRDGGFCWVIEDMLNFAADPSGIGLIFVKFSYNYNDGSMAFPSCIDREHKMFAYCGFVMALPKKGSRLIKVDGIEYRWIVTPDDVGLGIMVELAENPGQRMGAGFEYGNIISPWLVRKAILHALENGWHPELQGPIVGFPFDGIFQKEDEWIGVPEEYQEKWSQIYQKSQECLNLSEPCPVCSAVALHRWYQIGKPVERVIEGVKYLADGGLWEWCSSCRSFEHWNSLVPAWWSCELEVDEQQLTALPTALEVARQAHSLVAARKAQADIAAALATPMDYEKL
jgi:hypothetical protein